MAKYHVFFPKQNHSSIYIAYSQHTTIFRNLKYARKIKIIFIALFVHKVLKSFASFSIVETVSRHGGMVDTTDSKSVAGNRVRVQVSLPAKNRYLSQYAYSSQYCIFAQSPTSLQSSGYGVLERYDHRV